MDDQVGAVDEEETAGVGGGVDEKCQEEGGPADGGGAGDWGPGSGAEFGVLQGF